MINAVREVSPIARPRKCRRVSFIPENKHFVPLQQEGDNKDRIILKVEELEALRLKDINNLSQEECAKEMDVSRQTFQNIIGEAREKVARALVEGREIIIQGGNYNLALNRSRCRKCRRKFDTLHEKEKYCMKKCDVNYTNEERGIE